MTPADLLGSLLPPQVVWRGVRIGEPVAPLRPEELPPMARAVPARRAEFTAGRHCARSALAALTGVAAPVPASADRSPVWPDGVVGSITHDAPWCVAAVARRSEIAGLGVDITHVSGFHRGLESQVAAPGEVARLLDPVDERTRQLRLALMFCIKEAFYKAQYPLTRAWLDFADLALRLPRASPGTYIATLQRDAGGLVAGMRFRGRCAVDGDHCAAVQLLRG